MAEGSTHRLKDAAVQYVPPLQGGTQEQVQRWVGELIELTGWKAARLATESGLAASTLTRFLGPRAKHNLTTTTVNKLQDAAGPRIRQRVDAGELEPTQLGGDRHDGGVELRPRSERATPGPAAFGALAAGDYVLVAAYDVAAAAGDGTVVDDDHVTGWLAFQPQWLRRVTTAAPSDLGIVTVRGDSMEHTLKHDDTVLVDFTQRRPQRDGIFVIRYADAVQVKRISIHPVSKRLTVQSDNQAYPTYAELSPDDIDIVGRVIWLGRQV